MKRKVVVNVKSRLLISMNAVAVSCCLFAGCGGNPEQQAKVQAQRDEIAKLEAENKEIQRLKAENQELGRLRRDNQEIQHLRGSVKDLVKLRAENQQFKSRATDPGNPYSKVQQHTQAAAVQKGLELAQVEPVNQQQHSDSDLPQEGDEIFVEPKFLKLIVPDINWDRLERTEPVGIKSLLNTYNIVITNYQQLNSMGVTNYHIRRAPADNGATPQN